MNISELHEILVSPDVKRVDIHIYQTARLISAKIEINGIRLFASSAYAPTNAVNTAESSRVKFYQSAAKCLKDAQGDRRPHKHYHAVMGGDFNAKIGENSAETNVWDCIGHVHDKGSKTNENGQKLLQLCKDQNQYIMNTFFQAKKIHRHTWRSNANVAGAPPGTKFTDRIDYILIDKWLKSFARQCRVYRGTTANICVTDHFILELKLALPSNGRRKRAILRRQKPPSEKLVVSALRDDPAVVVEYSKALDNMLPIPPPPGTTMDELEDIICNAIKSATKETLPRVELIKKSPPWQDKELDELHYQFKKATPTNRQILQQKIKEKRKELKNEYYLQKSNNINEAAEARDVERQFRLLKSYNIHRQSPELLVSNEDLTKHFSEHFGTDYSNLEIPPEIKHPDKFPFLTPEPVQVNQQTPDKDEIKQAMSYYKNNKAQGLDKVKGEYIKYQNSECLLVYVTLLISMIWNTVLVPMTWLGSELVCLYKKGARSLAKNYRAISIAPMLSRLLPIIVMRRTKEAYERNLDRAQFGFRSNASTTDALFCIRHIIEKTTGFFVVAFVDLTAAYDKLPRDFIFRVAAYRFQAPDVIGILRKLYECTWAKVRGSKVKFDILTGCRQGGLESPSIFNCYFDFVLKICSEQIDKKIAGDVGIDMEFTIPIEATNRPQRSRHKSRGHEMLRFLIYADDLVVPCRDIKTLDTVLHILDYNFRRFGLTISVSKTVTVPFNSDPVTEKLPSLISLNGKPLENATSFKYLGLMLTNQAEPTYVEHRIANAEAKYQELKNVLSDQEIALKTRTKFLESCVRSRLLYSVQAWNMTAREQAQIEAQWNNFLRRLVRGGFRHREREVQINNPDGTTSVKTELPFCLTNEAIYRITGSQFIGIFLEQQKIKYLAHVCRMENNAYPKITAFSKLKKGQRCEWSKIAKSLGMDRGQLLIILSCKIKFAEWFAHRYSA